MTEIGATLREARLRARAEIIDVEGATKIRAKYLRALENEEWDGLPGPTFVKSFLRTYAEYLGLDARLLVEEFRRQHEAPADQEPMPIRPPRGRAGGDRDRHRRSSPVSPRIALIVFLVLGALAALYALGQWGGKNDNVSSGSRTTTTGRKAGATPRKHRRHKGRRKPVARPSTVKVQIVPTGNVYVCLTDARGHALIRGATLTAGRASPPFTGRKFLVTLGNGQARLRLNGHTVGVPRRAVPVSYVITPAGHKPLPAAKAPRCG